MIQDREQLIEDGLAKVEEVAKFLSIGRSKLYEAMDAGQLAYCKFGRSRRIPWRSVRQYAADSLMLAS
jgi:excisionase family DNA binding protein